jgi:hypothetical protein
VSVAVTARQPRTKSGGLLPPVQFVNDFGTWFGRVAVLTAVSQQSPRLAAVVVVADAVPRVIVGPVLARHGALNLRGAAVLCCLAEASVLLAAAAMHELTAVVVVLFAVRAALDTVLLVTIQTAMTRLTRPEDLLRANFRLSLASAGAILLAPVAAGALTNRLDLAWMLVIDATSYLLALALAARPLGRAAPVDARVGDAGMDAVPDPRGRPLLLSSGLATLAGGCFNACLPVLFLLVLDADPAGLGLALTLFGLGTVAINLIGLRIRRLHADVAVIVALAAGGVLLIALGAAPHVAVGWTIAFLFGAAAALRATSTRHLVQLAGGANPVPMLARWHSANNVGLLAGSALALLVAVPDLVRPTVSGLGLLYAAALVPLVAVRRRRNAREPGAETVR